MADIHGIIALATLSLPDRRPAMTTSSFTRFDGGARPPAISANVINSSGVIGNANAARKIAFYAAHVAPGNQGGNSSGASIASMMFMDQPRDVLRGKRGGYCRGRFAPAAPR
jgi:hypothetical protein